MENQYITNHYRLKKLINPHNENDKRFLMSTDHGSWIALKTKEYEQFITSKSSPELFKALEDKGIILNEKNTDTVINDYKQRLHYLFKGTDLHIVLPTLRCNKKCVYCHSSVKSMASKEFDMDRETAKYTLDFIFQSPTDKLTIEFQGGETLLNFDVFKYIVEEGRKKAIEVNKSVRFDLVSNLTLMTEEHIDWLIREKISICTSIDGPEQVHNVNRPFESGQPTHSTVIRNLKRFKDKGKHIDAIMVTTKASLPYWKEIIDEYVSLGLKDIQLKFLNKLGFAYDNWNDQVYSLEEFIDFWKKSVDYMIELGKKGIIIRERYILVILSKLLKKHDPCFLEMRSPCGMVIGQMAYNYNGDIYSCDEGRNFEMFNVGNVKTATYQDVVKNSLTLISSSINENLLCDNCTYKPWCGTCAVMNYAKEGNPLPVLPSNSHHILFEMMFDYVFEKLLFDAEAKKVMLTWME